MVNNLTTPPVAARRQCGHTVLHKTAADTQCECTRLTCRWSCRLCAIDGSQRDVLTVGDISTWTKDNKCEAPTCRRMGMPPAGHGSIVMQHHGLAQDSLKSLHVPACYEGLVAPASGGNSTCAHMLLSGTDLHKTAGHPPARRTSTGGWQQQRCWLPWCLAPPTGKEEIQPVACLLHCGLQPKAAAAAQSAVCLLQRMSTSNKHVQRWEFWAPPSWPTCQAPAIQGIALINGTLPCCTCCCQKCPLWDQTGMMMGTARASAACKHNKPS